MRESERRLAEKILPHVPVNPRTQSRLHFRTVDAFRVVMANHASTTAYLIWHFLTKKQYQLALDEYVRDGNKMNTAWFVEGRLEIRSALETLVKENP